MNSQKALEICAHARDDGALVCLYPWPYSSKFAAGFVEAVSDEHVVLRSVSPLGRADGWFLRALDEVSRIDWNGQYEKRLLFLAQMSEARWIEGFLPAIEPTSNLPLEVLGAAHKHDLPVQVDTGSDDPAEGFVAEVTPDWVTIDKIARDGSFDGEAIIELDELEKILVNEGSLQNLALLARHCGRGTGKWQ